MLAWIYLGLQDGMAPTLEEIEFKAVEKEEALLTMLVEILPAFEVC
jgi:hypothetical protein